MILFTVILGRGQDYFFYCNTRDLRCCIDVTYFSDERFVSLLAGSVQAATQLLSKGQKDEEWATDDDSSTSARLIILRQAQNDNSLHLTRHPALLTIRRHSIFSAALYDPSYGYGSQAGDIAYGNSGGVGLLFGGNVEVAVFNYHACHHFGAGECDIVGSFNFIF